MEVSMSLNALVRLPLSNSRTHEDVLMKHSLLLSSRTMTQKPQQRQRHILVVEAKGKRGMQARQFQKTPPPSLPKIEDDGNPRFVIFIRIANVCSLYLNLSFSSFWCWIEKVISLVLFDWCLTCSIEWKLLFLKSHFEYNSGFQV